MTGQALTNVQKPNIWKATKRTSAAIDHVNILYDQNLKMAKKSTLDSILSQNISTTEFPDNLIEEILDDLSSDKFQTKYQELVVMDNKHQKYTRYSQARTKD